MDESVPSWPILVQWDDCHLQVIGRDEWFRDSDLSCYPGQYLFMCDSLGRVLVQREGPPTRWWQPRPALFIETTGETATDEQLRELVSEDYRFTAAERDDLVRADGLLRRLLRFVEQRRD